MSVLNKEIVLVLNKQWQAIDVITPVQAFNQLCAGASTALNFEENGYLEPVRFDKWRKLPVREKDWAIGTSSGPIRVPVVVLLCNFDKVPKKKVKFSRRAVFERDGGIDQYTGEVVPYEKGNLDHVIPKSNGGKRDWNNIVWTSIPTNAKKRNRTPEQAGMRLLKKPVKPTQVRLVSDSIVNKHGITEWDMFLKKKKVAQSK